MLHFNYRLFFWVGLVVLLMPCSVFGQGVQKKQLVPEDYALWSNLFLQDYSTNGRWVTYQLTYESGRDTLYLQSTKDNKRFSYPKGSKGKFYKEQWFGCLEDNSIFRLTSLEGKKSLTLAEVLDFYFTDSYVLVFKKDDATIKKLDILAYDGTVVRSVDGITDYRYDEVNGKLVLGIYEAGSGQVQLLGFNRKVISSEMLLTKKERFFSTFYFGKKHDRFVFCGRDYGSSTDLIPYLYHYNLSTSSLNSVDLKEQENVVLRGAYINTFGIQEHGVYIKVKPVVKVPPEDESVTVWHSMDKDLTLRRKFQENFSDSKLLYWEPETMQLCYVADEEHGGVLVPENAPYALVFDPDVHKPYFTPRPNYDYYIKDLKSGEKKLVAGAVCSNPKNISVSITSRYIAYFKELDWWVYDVFTQKTVNITQSSDASFQDNSGEQTNESLPYGFMGWEVDESGFYLYDAWDVWFVDLKTMQSKRLTNGKETQSVFRNAQVFKGSGQLFDDALVISHPIFLLGKKEDYSMSGFFKLDAAKKLQTVQWDSKRLTSLKVSKDGSNCVFLSEDYDAPPSIVHFNEKKIPKVLFQSNRQHYQYSWGKTKLISYQNSKGEPLKGFLIYPIVYDSRNKYPMVVSIYERKTYLQHLYVNPTFLNNSHENSTLLSQDGYFVFYPDIRYEIGNPGYSATDCVTSAVQAVLKHASIDATRIGLLGHSFGGYETLFIITQTPLFATAIAGAGLSDLVSGYLSVNEYTHDSNSWRYEYDQMRMGKPLYDDFEGYLKNSPLYHLPKVNVPLFTYSGANDTNVDVVHSMKYYLGMRRLGKEQVHVLYADQHHVFTSRAVQKDLTLKIKDWFGHYLKGDSKSEWMQPR